MTRPATRAHSLVGYTVEIPVHYDLWMRGARFGRITSAAADGSHVKVQMDHPQVRRRLTVPEADFDSFRFLQFEHAELPKPDPEAEDGFDPQM